MKKEEPRHNSKRFEIAMPVIAKENLGPCAGCGLSMDAGEMVRRDGTAHAGCVPGQTVSVTLETETQPALFEDPPHQSTQTAKGTPVAAASVIQFDSSFNGPDYEASTDRSRLTGQLLRIFSLMRDRRWRTLEEIARATRDPATSVSAQLRHLRKPKFGQHRVDKRPRGERGMGLFEYRLLENTGRLSQTEGSEAA